MDARLKINIGDRIVEVEGSEQFVEKIYNEYKQLLELIPHKPPLTTAPNKSDSSSRDLTRGAKKKSPKASKGFTRVDLDLHPAGKQSLKEYVAGFDNPNKDELYLLVIHYLKDVLNISTVTVNHVYTCLDELNQRIPTFLKQVLTNTKNEKGWIDTSNFDNLTITTKGLNHLKHDMTKK